MSKFYTYTSKSGTNGGGGSGVQTVADATARLALTPTHGDLVVQLDNNTFYEYDGASWIVIGPGGSGSVTVADTNTIDISMPLSEITANIRYQDTNSVSISEDASGLKADLVIQDTPSILLEIDGSGLKADVAVQNTDTVGLAVDGSGIKADVLVQSTNSIDLTAGVGGLSADLFLSASAADSGYYNALASIEVDGLQVQVPILDSYPASYVSIILENNSGSLIGAEIPVCIDINGDIIPADVSSAISNSTVGVTVSSIADGASGEVMISGKLENVITSLSFGVCYVSDTATLSSTVPDIGVNTFTSGDYVIKIGNVVKNQTNPLNKDLIIQLQVMGKL